MHLDLIILIVSGLASALLGLLILSRNPRQAGNRRFAYLALGLIFWTTSNYLSDHATRDVLFYTQMTFVSGVAAMFTLRYFLENFPNPYVLKNNLYLRAHTIFSIVLLPIIFTPAFIQSVNVDATGSGVIRTSNLYYLFIVYVIYSLMLMFVILRQQNAKLTSNTQKQQLQLVSWGVILYSFLAVLSSVVLPALIKSWSSSRFGPAFALLFIAMVGYAIIKHKLFDIRLIVARSVAYSLTIVTVVLLYGFVAYGVIAKVFFKNQQFQTNQRVVFSVLTLILVFTFPKIQLFFNRVTNQLFYRDAYDTQAFLAQFNKMLVSTYELTKLLSGSATVIEENLKPTFCFFEIKETETTPKRLIGTTDHPVLKKDEIKVINSVAAIKLTVITADSLHGKQLQLKKTLRDNNIEIVAKLVTSAPVKDIGYIMFGPKKSGNLYSPEDLKIIEIITNELVIAVQNALRFEEIESFNLTLQARVDDATRKLRRTNEKLKALDETKDDFISMASHQLRTPLTSIKGYISMVMEGDAGKVSKVQQDMLNQAFFSSQRMVYLISDLLNVSRLKTGKFVIEPSRVNLAKMVEQELDQLKEAASARNLTLSYTPPENFPDVMLDETKTRQVIMNFADNAIYYTPAGGHVTVRLIDTPSTVEFRVEDNGIGVAKSDQPHLFTKFYRAGNARKARPDGTGLGLFMAKKVIAAEDGGLIFNSEEGKGSTFGFVFSKSKVGISSTAETLKPEAKVVVKA